MTGTGLPPDNTGIGRSRNAEMTSAAKQALVSLTTAYTQAMQKLGVTKTTGYVFDDMVISLDRYLQLSIRDLEYLRSDLREGLKFVGRVPTGLRGDSGLPPWWGLIVANKKPLVVVSQGTLSNEPEDLTIPAIEGLRELDVLVVATLVRKDYIENYKPPSNVKIAQWIPFENSSYTPTLSSTMEDTAPSI